MNIQAWTTKFWDRVGFKSTYQSCCQLPGYPGPEPGESLTGWNLSLPSVPTDTDSVIILECYDFLTVIDARCPELETIEQHYGNQSNQVIVIHWNIGLDRLYHGKLNLVYFPAHSFDVIKYINNMEAQWIDSFKQPRTHHWQCLNGRVCEHRRNVAHELQNFKLGMLSLGDEIKLSDWPYSTYRGTENQDNWIRLLPVYSACDINVVTETIYNHAPGIITEKTLMAFLALQVPIIIGHAGIVDQCEQLGFDMFRDVVNTSYDHLPNATRWQQALELNQQLLINGIDRLALQQRLERNQAWARTEWPRKLAHAYQQRIIEVHDLLTKTADLHIV